MKAYIEAHVDPFFRSILNSLKPGGAMVIVDHTMANAKAGAEGWIFIRAVSK